MSLRIALIGETGQLAKAIIHESRQFGHAVNAFDRSVLDLSWAPAKIETTLKKLLTNFDVLINAAAYTNVDKAEEETELAHAVNSEAPAAMARVCQILNLPFIHISTDYVFNGNNAVAYEPDDQTDPLGVYGVSKLSGEKEIMSSGTRALILRTSWVFAGTGKNFLTTMLRLSQSHESISVVNDQIGRPTYAGDLACASLKAAEVMVNNKAHQSAIYHVTNTGEPVSWAGFAVEIFKLAKKEMSVVEIPSSEFPTVARRPKFSVLNTASFEKAFGHELPHWKTGVRKALAV